MTKKEPGMTTDRLDHILVGVLIILDLIGINYIAALTLVALQ